MQFWLSDGEACHGDILRCGDDSGARKARGVARLGRDHRVEVTATPPRCGNGKRDAEGGVGSPPIKIRLNRTADALYIHIVEAAIDKTFEAMPGFNLDLDDSGRRVGIEMPAVRQRLPDADPMTVKLDAT